MWLLEKRAALAGVARPKSQTPKRWFPRLIEANESERASMEQFIAQQYRRLYAPSILQSSQGEQTDEVYSAARVVLASWTIRNMKSTKRCPLHSGS